MKDCGDCGLCCKLMGVASLDKPPGKWCSHFRRASGCAVYADRPGDCIAFNCTWLSDRGAGRRLETQRRRLPDALGE